MLVALVLSAVLGGNPHTSCIGGVVVELLRWGAEVGFDDVKAIGVPAPLVSQQQWRLGCCDKFCCLRGLRQAVPSGAGYSEEQVVGPIPNAHYRPNRS